MESHLTEILLVQLLMQMDTLLQRHMNAGSMDSQDQFERQIHDHLKVIVAMVTVLQSENFCTLSSIY